MEITLGVDVSRWNDKVDWKRLKAGGVVFAVVKSSHGTHGVDKLLRTHLEGAKAAGMVTGVYHWCDPTLYDGPQLENFANVTENLEIDFAAADVEQYWADWQEFFDKKVTKIVSPGRISENARYMAEGMAKVTGKKVLIYTRATFVQQYAQPMLNWLPGWDLWLAHYPYPRGRATLTWTDLLTRHMPRIAGPNLPEGCKSWKMWQFSGDRFVLPGTGGGPINLSMFNGTLDDLRAWCGRKPENAEDGAVSVEEKVRMLWEAHPELHGA